MYNEEKELSNRNNSNFDIEKLKKLSNSSWLWKNDCHMFKTQINSLTNSSDETKQCPICNEKALFFLPFNNRMYARCFYCGSLERHRFLYKYLKDYTTLFSKSNKLLHFAPESVFFDIFEKKKNLKYVTADIEKKENIKEQMDMCDIPYMENSFDYIIANHVLEHIPDDKKAMSELYRIIKPSYQNKDAKVILMIPFYKHLKTTFENEEYNTEELRLKYFGQKDHVRKYGLDFVDRLIDSGFKVNEITINDIFSKNEIEKYGLVKTDIIFECQKNY